MNQNGHSPPTHRFQPPIATAPRRQPPSNGDPTILIFFLVILFSLFLFFIFFLPPPSPHIPNIIKSNFGSLVVFLFLFSIISGVFTHRNDVRSTPNVTTQVNRNRNLHVNGELRRRISSRSYLDLRQKPRKNSDNRRSYDDFGSVAKQYSSMVNNHSRPIERRTESIYRSEPVSGEIRHRHRHGEPRKVYSRVDGRIEVVRNVPEVIVERRSPKRVRPPPPPPARSSDPDLPVSVESRRRRASRSVRIDETVQISSQTIRLHDGFHFPPPPPSAAESANKHRLHLNDNNNKLDREAIDSKKKISPTITSLDDQMKRNRNYRQKSRDIQPYTPSIHNTPPPQSTVQPPSPPSQPKSSPLRRRPPSTHKPPLPKNVNNYRDDFLSSDSQSSSIPIAPPPPPPFRLPAWIFELRGHYVRLRSVRSSDFGSSDRDDLPSTIDGGDSFGPSPISSRSSDVNAKAERFISRLKQKWRTERKWAQAHNKVI